MSTPPEIAALWDPLPPYTFLGGGAGVGKTYLTKRWADHDPGLLLTASTGIAAINLGGGQTINAALGYFDAASLRDKFTNGLLTGALGRLWKSGVRRIIIDEASMISADVLTYIVRAIEELNGRGYVLEECDEDEPEPSMGLTLVGDPLQLAPIPGKLPPAPGKIKGKNAPIKYFFESEEWFRFAPAVQILTEIKRQSDAAFIDALRATRRGSGGEALTFFRSRLVDRLDDHFEGSTLFAKNDSVDRHNQLRLDELPGAPITFVSARWGDQRSEWGHPDKPPATWGIPQELRLKEGALVMILANAYDEHGALTYVNGDLGTIQSAEGSNALVTLQRTGRTIPVSYVRRQVKTPADAVRRKELRAEGHEDRIDGKWEIRGEVTYMPLRLAYASTVHKSQGLTLDRVQIDLRDHFFTNPAMVYVALSRARTAEGLRVVGSPAVFADRCRSEARLKEWW